MEATLVQKPGQQAGLADWISYADQLIGTQQYEYLGKMKLLVLEASQGANVPGLAETNRVGVRLDWRDEVHPSGRGTVANYIRIAQSLDKRLLLALDPVVRRGPLGNAVPVDQGGQVGLPDLPDFDWKPPIPTQEQIEQKGGYFNPDPPMISQPLIDRASGRVAKTNLMCFQPVHQIMFQPELNNELQATYWTIACGHDRATRTDMAFLVDAKTGIAYFFGGLYQIVPFG